MVPSECTNVALVLPLKHTGAALVLLAEDTCVALVLSAECTGAPRVWGGRAVTSRAHRGHVWGVCFGEQLVLLF